MTTRFLWLLFLAYVILGMGSMEHRHMIIMENITSLMETISQIER